MKSVRSLFFALVFISALSPALSASDNHGDSAMLESNVSEGVDTVKLVKEAKQSDGSVAVEKDGTMATTTITSSDGKEVVTVVDSADGQTMTVDTAGEEVYVADARNADVGGGGSSGLVSVTHHTGEQNSVYNGASALFKYKYDINKYKTGSRYYYSIRNLQMTTCLASGRVTCPSKKPIPEYRNSTVSGRTSYAYLTPIFTGNANYIATAEVKAPKNT